MGNVQWEALWRDKSGQKSCGVRKHCVLGHLKESRRGNGGRTSTQLFQKVWLLG